MSDHTREIKYEYEQWNVSTQQHFEVPQETECHAEDTRPFAVECPLIKIKNKGAYSISPFTNS